MAVRVRAALRRRRRRAVVLCAVLVLGAAVTLAHSSAGIDHMGEAMALCSAVLVVGAVAAASLPTPGRRLPRRPRPADLALPRQPEGAFSRSRHCTRGDPAFLQVFRT